MINNSEENGCEEAVIKTKEELIYEKSSNKYLLKLQEQGELHLWKYCGILKKTQNNEILNEGSTLSYSTEHTIYERKKKKNSKRRKEEEQEQEEVEEEDAVESNSLEEEEQE